MFQVGLACLAVLRKKTIHLYVMNVLISFKVCASLFLAFLCTYIGAMLVLCNIHAEIVWGMGGIGFDAYM